MTGDDEVEDKRLDRIETKLDELTKVVTDLARIEERMVTLFKRMDKYDAQHTTMDERLSDVEEITTRRGAIFMLVDKAFWLVVGAGIAWIVKTSGG